MRGGAGMRTSPRIDLQRLLGRLDAFNRIGALPGGGNCRLALSEEDRAGRDLLVRWMREIGLRVSVDAIGNIIGTRAGREELAPVMFGSHVDTVGTGGRYDGLYGVLAGLEACEALNRADQTTRRPLALVAFTNAGTTPMDLRRDAACAAGEIAVFVRRLAQGMGGQQKGTVGRIELYPNLVNVVAERAVLTVDLRNTDASLLQQADQQLADFLKRLAQQEHVAIATRRLARFEPVSFPAEMVSLVETTARELALPCRRLFSGAGHDPQMMARLCPATMIFLPSVGGLSHNVHEYTAPEHLEAGASVLLNAVLRLADEVE